MGVESKRKGARLILRVRDNEISERTPEKGE
jgi:hypothetical protein